MLGRKSASEAAFWDLVTGASSVFWHEPTCAEGFRESLEFPAACPCPGPRNLSRIFFSHHEIWNTKIDTKFENSPFYLYLLYKKITLKNPHSNFQKIHIHFPQSEIPQAMDPQMGFCWGCQSVRMHPSSATLFLIHLGPQRDQFLEPLLPPPVESTSHLLQVARQPQGLHPLRAPRIGLASSFPGVVQL